MQMEIGKSAVVSIAFALFCHVQMSHESNEIEYISFGCRCFFFIRSIRICSLFCFVTRFLCDCHIDYFNLVRVCLCLFTSPCLNRAYGVPRIRPWLNLFTFFFARANTLKSIKLRIYDGLTVLF